MAGEIRQVSLADATHVYNVTDIKVHPNYTVTNYVLHELSALDHDLALIKVT